MKWRGETAPRERSGGHPPRGECGLKSELDKECYLKNLSPPTRGVWIEIPASHRLGGLSAAVTPHAGGVD